MRSRALLVVTILTLTACSDAPAVTATTSTTSPPPDPTSTTATTTTTATTPTTPTTEAPPETTETTAAAEVDPQYVLFLDGFSAFGLLGDGVEGVFGAFEAAFGPPTADSDWIADHGCAFEGSMRTVTWIEPGVRLVFVEGDTDYGSSRHLAAYSTLLPIDPPWELAGGIRRGMTLEQVQVVFPDAEIVAGEALQSIRLMPGVESYVSIDAAGEIREFWAGGDYC